MDLTVIHIGEIMSKDQLVKRSNFNKRVGFKTKIREYLENKLSDEDLEVDWSKCLSDYDYIPTSEGESYMDLFDERHEKNPFYLDNKDFANYGIEIITGYERELHIDFNDWLEKQFEFFCSVFDESNILSFMVHKESEKNPHVHVYVYCVDKRGSLTAYPCKVDGKVNPEFISLYESKMKEYNYDNEYRKEKVKNIKKEIKQKDDTLLGGIDRYIPEIERSEKDNNIKVFNCQSAFKTSIIPYEEQENILERIIDYFENIEPETIKEARTGKISKETFFLVVEGQLRQLGIQKSEEIKLLKARVDNMVFGNYILEPLIDDDLVSDIKIYNPKHIRIKRQGQRMSTDLAFKDTNDYLRFIEGLAIKNGKTLSRKTAVQYFVDTVSSKKTRLRVDLNLPYVNSNGFPIVAFRKTPKKYTIDELILEGMMDTKVGAYLLDKVKTAKGMLFTGKGGSGKSSLMNALIDEIPYNNSVLVIQEGDELYSDKHPDILFQKILPQRFDGDSSVSLKDLAMNGLVVDVDYYVIGEIKGAEAWYFMNAATSGHKCWASCHGATPEDALTRLADYVQYESSYNQAQALKQLKDLEIVVFMKDFKVMEISQITGYDYEKNELTFEKIYKRTV